jgi:DNA mismatch repair protein MutS
VALYAPTTHEYFRFGKFTRKLVTRKLLPKNLVTLVADLTSIGALQEKTQDDHVLSKYLAIQSIVSHCQTIINDINRIFNLTECHNLSEITEDTLIINKGISPTVDALIRDNLDGRDKLEAICKYLSALLQATEKNSNETKKNQYVKIHETAKNPPVLIGTSLRIKKLKDVLTNLIKKSNKTTVQLSYQSNYSQTTETFELDLQTLETDTNGGSKNDLVITNKQIELITKNNEDNKTKLVREMESLFQNYLTEFEKYDTAMQQIIKYTIAMDVLQCKCYIAHKYNYCKPVLQTQSQKSFFTLTGIRHPLIEHLQTNELYVTNDLSMGDTPKPPPVTQATPLGDIPQGWAWGVSPQGCGGLPPKGVLLYGTNAVGKTSFIKSVGIAVIMAQAGLYVPCSTFEYKPYHTIFTRILGNDNLFKGLSTFAVEMTELRTILTMANKNSLVLGDELCSGTESDSALSIFTAGLEILHERDSTFLFATHFHEITKYEEIKALTNLKMLHMAVHYDKSTNALVYDRKLREGSGESMYGLEVCKSLHLPDAFLQRAHAIRMKYHQETQNVLSLSPTHFNAKKIVGNCELCLTNKASEVHHLQHQKNAKQSNDYIETFHKNHVANLLNICEACHQKIHHSGQQHRVVKTTKGYQIIAI